MFDDASEVAVLVSIMINRRKGGNFSKPLSFESQSKNAKPVDLYPEAFGERPNLLPVLGSEVALEHASLFQPNIFSRVMTPSKQYHDGL